MNKPIEFLWDYSPLVGQVLHIRGYAITLRHTTIGKTLYVQSARRRDNTQHSQETDIHAHGGIQTHDPSKPAASDPPLRPRGHWDRLNPSSTQSYYTFSIIEITEYVELTL